MKAALFAIIFLLSIASFAQNQTKENEVIVVPEFILDQFNELEFKTFNYQGEENIRHYGIDDNILYGAFGSDGEGSISNAENFSKDELLYVALIAIKGLNEKNNELEQRVFQLEEEIMRFVLDNEMKKTEETEKRGIEEKIIELEEKIKAIEELKED